MSAWLPNTRLPLAAAAAFVIAGPAHAETELLAYFPFDGAPDEAARGIPTEVINVSGGELTSVEGKYGEAYEFGERFESAVIAAELDIDFNTYRQLSASAWVKLGFDRAASGGYIFSSGSSKSGAPRMGLYNEDIRTNAGRSKPRHSKKLKVGVWTHVAAVWDYDEQSVRIYVDGEPQDFPDQDMDPADLAANGRNQPLLEHPTDNEKEDKRYLVIGALTLEGYQVAEDAAIDDLRIYEGKLTPGQVESLRTAESPAPLGDTAPPVETEEQKTADSGDSAEAGEGEETSKASSSDDRQNDDNRKLAGLRLSDEYSISKLSGDSAEQTEMLDLQSVPVRALRIQQDNSVAKAPCEVAISSEPPGNFDFTPNAGKKKRQEFSKCLTSGITVDAPGAQGARLLADYETGYYLQSLRVCQNGRQNNRVKGFQSSAVRVVVDQDANVIAFKDVDTQETILPRCSEWKELVSCDKGVEVASGVRIRYDTVNNLGKASVTGLELVCRKVEGVYEEK
ncbi:LamG domain-containing protein [Hyphococcus luteus]|nr:LamG domain-containing protein [Marinicaulis flavus]